MILEKKRFGATLPVYYNLLLTAVSQQFEQWEFLDAVIHLEQDDKHPISAEISTQRDTIENKLRDSELPFQDKALSRAKQLVKATSLHEQHKTINARITAVRWAITLLMSLLGSFAVINVFDSAINQVNVFWLIIVLLGVNTLSMVFYAIAAMQKKATIQSIPTALFKTVLHFLNTKSPTSSSPQTHLMNSWSTLNLTGQVGRWTFSRFLHGAWLAYLLGALTTLVLILLVKQINFVWGTTLLNGDAFIHLTNGMSKLQSSLGLPILSKEQILLSRLDAAPSSMDNLNLAQNRQKWAYFLITSVLLYGIFPRFSLWTYSLIKQHLAQKSYQPEWNTPYFVQLRERMIPSNSSAVVVDADTHHFKAVSGLNNNDANSKHIEITPTKQRIQLHELPNRFSNETILCAYEWSHKNTWPVTDSLSHWGVIENRQQQEDILSKLQSSSSNSKLAICISSEQVADRGALRFFSHLNQAAELYLLIFDFSANKNLKRRWAEWLHLADQLPLDHQRIILVDANHK